MPKVTVLMPVFNGEAYLRDAIESILGQTFDDYEFLIIDDGSTDSSPDIVKSFSDPRIRFERYDDHCGTVHALNNGIRLSRGKYIARMDADDISLPHRLENQVRFMDAHPDTGICGSGIRIIKKGKLKNRRYQPEFDQELKITLLFNTCFFHPTVIMKKAAIEHLLYPKNFVYTQDYNFWTRLAPETRFANLPEILVYFREHARQISQKKADLQKSNARRIRESYLHSMIHDISDDELETHHQVAETREGINLTKAKKWLEHLVDLNTHQHVYSTDIFLKEVGRKWWLCCRKNTQYGKDILDLYKSSYLHNHYRPSTLKYLKFFFRCLTRESSDE